MKSVNIILTTKCNWDCDYCNCTKYGEYIVTKDSIDRHVHYIKDILDCEYVLSGGEIGLVPQDILAYLLKKMDRPVVINTNGLFMEKGYHLNPEIRRYIDKIYYHVVAHPEKKKVPFHFDDNINILYGITGSNINGLVDFIKENEGLNISYIGMDNKFDNSIMDYMKLYISVKDYPNVKDALPLLESYCLKQNKIHLYRKKCSMTNFAIDLSKEVICKCGFRNKHIDIELSEENLIKVTTEFNVFPDTDNCDKCSRVCMDVNFEDAVLTRRSK